MAKIELAAVTPQVAKQAHQGADTRAINKADITEVQQDLAGFA